MTTIEHILGWGEWSTVLLACGHRRHLRRQEIDLGPKKCVEL